MRNLLAYRQLILELAFRDLKLQYQKPFLGFLWMLIIPFSTAIIYKILFSDFFHVTNGEYPFLIHLITALLPWNYFVCSVQGANKSILNSKNIISQTPFPKYLMPVSIIVVNLINFLPTILIIVGFLIVFKVKISLFIIFLPLVILIQTGIILGLSFMAAGLQVIYRDIEYIIQILLMALFFLTPSVYTYTELTRNSNPYVIKFYLLNPLVGILNLYRLIFIDGYWNTLPKEAGLFNVFINPVIWSVVLLFTGYFVFKKCEKHFYDYLNS